MIWSLGQSWDHALCMTTAEEDKGTIWSGSSFCRCLGIHSAAGSLIYEKPLPITSRLPPHKVSWGHITIIQRRGIIVVNLLCILFNVSHCCNFIFIFTSLPFIGIFIADFKVSAEHLLLVTEVCILTRELLTKI